MTLNGCTAPGGRDFNLKVAISRKRCEIGPTLQLITNRKSYTGFDWHRRQWPWMTLSTRIELFYGFYIFFAVRHTCTAVARSLCVSWAFLFLLQLGLVRAPKGRSVPSARGEIFWNFYAEMVRFSAYLTGLMAHCREHYLWLSLENWLKLSAESINIKILLIEIRDNQMTRCGSFSAACCQTTLA